MRVRFGSAAAALALTLSPLSSFATTSSSRATVPGVPAHREDSPGGPAYGSSKAPKPPSAAATKDTGSAPRAPGQCPDGTAEQITQAIAKGVAGPYAPFTAATRDLSGPGFLAQCLGELKAKQTGQSLRQIFEATIGKPHTNRLGNVDNHEYGYANMLHELQYAFDGSPRRGSRNTYVDLMQKQAGWWKLKPGHTASNNPDDYYAAELRHSKKGLYKTGRLVEISGWGVPASQRVAYHPGKKAAARPAGKKAVARKKKGPAHRAAPRRHTRRPRSHRRLVRRDSPRHRAPVTDEMVFNCKQVGYQGLSGAFHWNPRTKIGQWVFGNNAPRPAVEPDPRKYSYLLLRQPKGKDSYGKDSFWYYRFSKDHKYLKFYDAKSNDWKPYLRLTFRH